MKNCGGRRKQEEEGSRRHMCSTGSAGRSRIRARTGTPTIAAFRSGWRECGRPGRLQHHFAGTVGGEENAAGGRLLSWHPLRRFEQSQESLDPLREYLAAEGTGFEPSVFVAAEERNSRPAQEMASVTPRRRTIVLRGRFSMRGGAPASCARTHSLQTGPGAPCARPAKGDGRFAGSPVRFLAGQTHVSRNQRCSRGLPVTGTVAVRRTPRTRGCRCCARLRARGTGPHGNRGGPGHRARWLPNFRPSVYSTVTDFARFRGLSTSRPSATAAW